MKIVLNYEEGWPVGVELTRRNLRTLLAKLDGNPPGSACTILAPGDMTFFVKAVEDAEHYTGRPSGVMHPETEAALHGDTCNCLACEVEGL